jgi:hypothetical protein
MSEKQIFSALVRAVGIIVFLEGLRTFWIAFVQYVLPITFPVPGWGLALAVPTLSYGLFSIVLGSTMIRWPEWLVHLAWLERLPTIGRMPDDES